MSNQAPIATPDFRATIAGGRLTLVRWHPQLMASWGPATAHFRSRDREGVGVADLTVVREPEVPLELIVKFLSGGDRADVRETIVRWAASLGYGRVWLPDDLLDLAGEVITPTGPASTQCSACQARWEDGDPEFWLAARSWGNFPLSCPLCGADLPQWEVDAGPHSEHGKRNAPV